MGLFDWVVLGFKCPFCGFEQTEPDKGEPGIWQTKASLDGGEVKGLISKKTGVLAIVAGIFALIGLGQTSAAGMGQSAAEETLFMGIGIGEGVLVLIGVGVLFFVIWRYIFPVSWFIWKLRSSNYDVRKSAAHALDELGWTPQSQSERISYLIAKQQWTELVKIGTPAIPALIQALKDRDWRVRNSAAYALDKIKKKDQ